ncbi:signal recognition particle protein [Mycoplasmoides pneumoniae]|uniref:signal recognition particle protein n=1 Tax=Mycoplasmoides pneumoniae TaxID=2104 RepID=UPI00071B6E2E|nr:signal recognition particle protein [Mycoplasmoides pneumoniae]
MFKSMISSIVMRSMQKKINAQTISETDVQAVLKEIRIALLDADVNLLVVKNFIKAIREQTVGQTVEPGQDLQKWLLKVIKQELINILSQPSQEITSKRPLKVMVVGLQGSGKTTTCGKLAVWLKKQFQQKAMLVALDIYRPAAIDQLATLAEQTESVFFAKGTQAPDQTTKEAVKTFKESGCQAIICDTAGRLQTNQELMDELVAIKNELHPDEILMVVDGLSGQEIINVAKEFHNRLKLTGFIITKLDSDARAGAALSLTSLLEVPIKLMGTSEKLTGLEQFHPERIASRILGLGDVMTLVEKAEEVFDKQSLTKTVSKMFLGKMDLEDLLLYMEQMNQMGSVSSIVKMLPGNLTVSDDHVESIEAKVKLWKVLINSMTREERRHPKLINRDPSRKQRIIKGSGRKMDELNKLMKEWSKLQTKTAEMGRMLKGGKNPFSGFGGLGGLGF